MAKKQKKSKKSKKAEVVVIKRTEVVAMFVALGLKSAPGWKEADLNNKIAKLPDIVDEETDLEDAEAATLATILSALEDDNTIEVQDDVTDAKAKKKPAKSKKKPKKEEPEEEDEDDEDEEEDDDEDEDADDEEEEDEEEEDDDEDEDADDEEEEDEDEEEEPEPPKKKKKPAGKSKPAAKKPAAKKKAANKSKPKQPGVIALTIDILKTASAEKPITKDGIVKKLAKKIDRPAEAMAKTVAVQVPNRLNKEKGADVLGGTIVRCEETGGYYISDKAPKKSKKKPAAKKAPAKKKTTTKKAPAKKKAGTKKKTGTKKKSK